MKNLRKKKGFTSIVASVNVLVFVPTTANDQNKKRAKIEHFLAILT